jgi:hypothetical protein
MGTARLRGPRLATRGKPHQVALGCRQVPEKKKKGNPGHFKTSQKEASKTRNDKPKNKPNTSKNKQIPIPTSKNIQNARKQTPKKEKIKKKALPAAKSLRTTYGVSLAHACEHTKRHAFSLGRRFPPWLTSYCKIRYNKVVVIKETVERPKQKTIKNTIKNNQNTSKT